MTELGQISEIEIKLLTLASIVHRCSEECQRFFRRTRSDPRYCFELFRRAIEEQNQLAWQHTYSVFSPLVSGWILRHPAFQDCEEEVGYFINRAFERFWSALSPEKFNRYPNLESLLQYIQVCVNSVVVDYRRRMRVLTIPILEADPKSQHLSNSSSEGRVNDHIEKEQFWEQVSASLKNDLERVVIHAGFVMGFKAREIFERYPSHFQNVQEVYQIRKNVLARLERDAYFKEYEA